MLATEIVPPLLYRIEHIGALIILHYKIETTYVTGALFFFNFFAFAKFLNANVMMRS